MCIRDRFHVVGVVRSRPEFDDEPGVDGDGRGARGRQESGSDDRRQRHDVHRTTMLDELTSELGRVTDAAAGALQRAGQVAHVVRLKVVLLCHSSRQVTTELVNQLNDVISLYTSQIARLYSFSLTICTCYLC